MEYLKQKQLNWNPNVQTIVQFAFVFFIILIAAKFGQYIFYEWQTSPAILWPPTGIAVAIMWLYGYRFALPILLGLLIASVTGPTAAVLPAAFITPFSQVAGQIFGVYLLKKFKFEGSFVNLRNALVFLISIVLLAIISPLVSMLIDYFVGNVGSNYFTVLGRRWAGYAFSCLILTPFIISWLIKDEYRQKNNLIETVFVGILTTVSTYLLFWTRVPAEYGFIAFALYFLAVVWVCLRFPSRIVTLTVVFITSYGILGLFVSPAPDRALNSQVFASELFFFIVVPIMYAYTALVKERQNNLDKLRIAFSEIEQENENKSNFIAVLAHELRNPLAPIKTTLEIMKLQAVEPQIKPLLTSAYNQVHVMRRLLDDLLDVTRVTQGKFELKTETVELQKLLDSVIDATKEIVKEHGHTLELNAKSKNTILVQVDPIRFEQVLVNVINNAAKFTDRGGYIEISYSVKEPCLELRIKDNGKGIERDNLDQIFNSFWQIKDTSTASVSGIGVGLALSKQIIELHDGSIKAESKGLGQGSTFVISIPCIVTKSAVAEKKMEETHIVAASTILVVDDNKPAADALAQLLTIKGHAVKTAYSGSEALLAVEESAPEIILLDIGLPDISGYDVAKSLREKGFKGAVLAVSGYGQQDDKEKALTVGCDAHFTKPLAIGTLEEYLYARQKDEAASKQS